jgi:alginate O-acetyltransferase complex protein AlgI
MLFTSHIFVYYFLPLLLLVYYNFPHRGRNLLLTAMSYAFYGWWNPYFTSLMLFSTVLNFLCGKVIAMSGARPGRRKAALAASIVVNLGLLGFFKYFMFFTDSVTALLALRGDGLLPLLRVTLPIGISFYTFQAMSYTIDLYRGEARPARSLVDFACFVSLFPQLLAGPIIRYHTVAAQLDHREHSLARFSEGVALFILGFAKKVLLANVMGEVADAVFGAAAPTALDAWCGALAYALQIYFDFAAYSDLAIGLGRMFGFEFPRNFDAPYLADSITDFWRRWHISLSTFLRDYLYIPLGGNRKGPGRTYVNLAVVMLFGGLWHGANWTFVAWGAMHGALLAWERWMGKNSLYAALPRPARVAVTLVLVLVTWVLFRAESLSAAGSYLAAMFGLSEPGNTSLLLSAEVYTPRHLAVMLLCLILTVQPIQAFDWSRRTLNPVHVLGLLALFVFALVVMSTQAFSPFLYFKF